MQIVVMPYQWFVDRYFTQLALVQSVGEWQVWSARQYHSYLLLAVNEIEEVVIKCQYESSEERAEEVDLLRRLPQIKL